MENMNLTNKNKEVLKSGAFKELGDAMRAEIVKEYLRGGYAGGDKQHDIEVSGITYKVLDRGEVTAFYDALGNTLFSVENEKLAAEYAEMRSGDNADSAAESENGSDVPERKNPDSTEPDEKSEGSEAPAKCITGKSKSGICGAAAYCDKGLECCSACENPCNSRCGWLDVQEKSSVDEAPATTEKSEEDFKGKACEKLRGELGKASDKSFADPVLNHIIERVRDSESLAKDVLQKHKTWDKCYQYIRDQARKVIKGSAGSVRDSIVYEWAEDYYHLDDKAAEEKKAKVAAERRKKEDEQKQKKKEKAKSNEKAFASNNQLGGASAPVTESKPQHKPKKNEIDGQMDLFSLMGM